MFEPTGDHSEEIRGREDHGEVQEAQSNMQAQPAAHSSGGPGRRLLGLKKGVFPVGLGFFVPPNNGRYGYGPPYGILHTDGPLRVALHAPGQLRFAWVVRQGDQ